MVRLKKQTKPVAFFIGLTSFALCLGLSIFTAHLLRRASWTSVLTAETLSENLGPVLRAGELPNPIQVEIPRKEGRQTVRLNYTIDPQMQSWSWKLVNQYHPDYAAVVLLDAQTGEILTLLSFSEFPISQHLALEASFPAASIFKIVTAAAAIDQKILEPQSVVTFHGSNHTLYRRNVYGNEKNRWVRQMTLIDAFARSVNTVFAKIGMFMLSPIHLQEYGKRFLFNRDITTDIPIKRGHLQDPLTSEWELAEVASGFNRVSLMSPMQGALIAASIANDGVMMRPYLIKSVRDEEGNRLYLGEAKVMETPIRPETAEAMRTLMRRTVQSGTSRSTFRTLVRQRRFHEVEFGGKTGSLMSLSPKGKCDWFVGYALAGDRKLAVSVMSIHGEFWRVKSSYLARAILEQYLRTHGTVL